MILKTLPTTIFNCTQYLLQKNVHLSEEEQELLVITMFAMAQYHGSDLRISGDLYLIHPLEVACILTAVKSDLPTIQAGLLHDVLEDTDATADELMRRFGQEVYSLVEAVTRYKMFSHKEYLEKVYAKSKRDPRIACIKLADQCSNHRNDGQSVFSPQKHLEHLQEHEEFYLEKIADIPDLSKELVQAFHQTYQESKDLYTNRRK